jgi:hypothetical protein
MQYLKSPAILNVPGKTMELSQEINSLNFIPDVMKHPCKHTTSIAEMYEKSMGQLQLQILNIIVKNQPENQNIVCIGGTIDMLVNLDKRIVNDFTVFDRTKNCKILIYNVVMSFIKNGVKEDVGHGTALIVDRDHKTIELFDPTGKEAEWSNIISKKLKDEFGKVLPSYRFIRNDFCPYIGNFEGEGICGAYALLFLILKIYNYQLEPGQIVARLSRLSQYQLATLMGQFLCYIDDLAIGYNLYELLEFSNSLIQYVTAMNPNILNDLYEVIDNGNTQALIDFANRNGVPLAYT